MRTDPTQLSDIRPVVLQHVQGEVFQKALNYLFDVYPEQRRVSSYDVQNALNDATDGSVGTLLSRLRSKLFDFASYDPVGRKLPYRVLMPAIDRGNYALVIEPNNPPTGIVPALWACHFQPSRSSFAYPEVPANLFLHPQDDSRMALPRCNGKLIAEHNVVPAPLIRAIAELNSAFRPYGESLGARPFRSYAQEVEGNAIILATWLTSANLLTNISTPADMKLTDGGITHYGESSEEVFRDDGDAPSLPAGRPLAKFLLLTRHHYQHQRTTTILAAHDGATMVPVVRMLASEEGILPVAREFQVQKQFPDHFQLLFRLSMVRGHDQARRIDIVKAIDLSAPRKSVRTSRVNSTPARRNVRKNQAFRIQV